MSTFALTGKSTETPRGESNKLTAPFYARHGLTFASEWASLVRHVISVISFRIDGNDSTPFPGRAWAEANQRMTRALR